MKIRKRGKFWAVFDDNGRLICLAIYRKGALEVIKKLTTEGRKNNVYKMEKYR